MGSGEGLGPYIHGFLFSYRYTLLFYSASFSPDTRRTYTSQADAASGKAVLVTGCDSGFGFSLAKHLHSKGFLVFAGCLLKDKGDAGVRELDSLKSDRLRTIQLNVCNSEEVEKAVETVRSGLKDPEKGKSTATAASVCGHILRPLLHAASICWQLGKRVLLCLFKLFLLLSERKWIKLNEPVQ